MHRLVAFVLAAATCAATSGAQSATNAPPAEFINRGTCPFECCVYRDWKTNREVTLVDRPRGTRVITTIPARRSVKGVTGQVITKPRRWVARHDFTEGGIRKGDVYYVLHGIGEGYWAVWFKGRVVEVPLDTEDGTKPVETDDSVWWVQIRTADGRVGWAISTDNFDNQDFLRVSDRVLVAVASADDALTERDVEALRGVAKGPGAFAWLAPGRAGEIPFAGDLSKARAVFAGRAIDINAVASTGRRKKLLIADMDSTIINCEVVDELADFARVKAKVAAITERAVNGKIEFAAAVRERVALLKGLPLDRVRRVYGERIRLNPGARALVATMRAHGAYTMLVSGGFTWFTERVAADAGFDFHAGNTLIDDGTMLTGTVAEPVLGREAKLEALNRTAAERGISLADTLAVGDGANDLDMIRAAGLGVAYHAKPIVAAAAAATVTHGDLTALLYLQGYRESEIVRL